MESPAALRHFVLVPLLVLAGCANPARDRPGVLVNKDDYESVTPLGSHISVLVKKGQNPANSSQIDTVSADRAENALHSGGGQIAPTPGQKP
jgi:hypothetical protein